jgi:hypothetical protein
MVHAGRHSIVVGQHLLDQLLWRQNCKTPNLDRLAAEGFRYTHCFSNAAVCAPTRATWITGMYAISNGTQPMRSRNEILHDAIKYYPDLLRQAGYHTSNWTKTNEITGRFFRPRVSEEFYDTVADFDNVHNLIEAPEHQTRIARLRQALRNRQLELYDSGLLPETMRARRAREHNLTIYEMVRDPKLYPLASYLDAADRALARNADNLPAFVRGMSDSDSGIRYWAVVGLHLLQDKAAPTIATIEKALQDESDEVKIMAAWTLVKLGRRETGLACLRQLLNEGTTIERELFNVLDWMEEDAVPLVREYLAAHPKKATSILAKIAQDHGGDLPK